MNMSILTIQYKSIDSQLPMNGKMNTIANVHSIGFSEGILFVTYEDNTYQMNEEQIRLELVSSFFIT